MAKIGPSSGSDYRRERESARLVSLDRPHVVVGLARLPRLDADFRYSAMSNNTCVGHESKYTTCIMPISKEYAWNMLTVKQGVA